jgi:hypothetical protein
LKIKLDADVLGAAIKSMQRLTQPPSLAVEAGGGLLTLTGGQNGSLCSLTVPIISVEDKKGEKAFLIDTNALLGAISRRKEITLTIKESSVMVASKGYSADLMVHAYEKLEVVPDEVKKDKGGFKLKDKFLKALRENLSKVELKPLLAMYDYVPIGVKATKDKGTFVACFDDFQSAFYIDKELTGNVEFLLPSNLFGMITRELKDQDYTMSITDTAVYAYNDIFELSMARPQTEGDQVTLDQAIGLYADIKKRKDFVDLKIQTEGIRSLLENGKAIYEKDSTFTFKVEGTSCLMTLKSSFGTINGKIKLNEKPSKDIEFTCDFSFFSTLLEKAPAEMSLRVSKDMLLFQNKPVTYLLSLV